MTDKYIFPCPNGCGRAWSHTRLFHEGHCIHCAPDDCEPCALGGVIDMIEDPGLKERATEANRAGIEHLGVRMRTRLDGSDQVDI